VKRYVIGQLLLEIGRRGKFVNVNNVNFSELVELPVQERIRLVSALWDSIAEHPESIELTDAERRELDRRMEAYLKDPTGGTPWPEVKAKLLAR
jgi:putative addiction module component (TIGR02574 family)